MRDTVERFSGVTVGLHWVIAVGVIVMIAFGLFIEDLPRGPEKSELIGLHKSVGALILALALARFAWRMANGMPRPVGQYSDIEHLLAKIVHWTLLLGTLFMPVSGILMSIANGYGLGVFGLEIVPFLRDNPGFQPNQFLSEIGEAVHGLGGWLLIAAIALHVVGALKHHIIDRDRTLRRMLAR